MSNKKQIKRTHPGKYLKDALEEKNMTYQEFAFKTGIPEETVNNIILEKKSVTPEIADKLSAFFGSSSTLWMNLQKAYDEYNRVD